MAATRHEEVERKYAVGADTACPTFEEVAAVAEVGPAVVSDLEAVYFDTPGLGLLRRGITLRRRVGGHDEGWHLKEPAGPDTRTETRLPLGRSTHTVPKRLRELVEPTVDAATLTPVARVTTHRTEWALREASGATVAHFCDDVVGTERLVPPTVQRHWREWEVELATGRRELLEPLQASVLAAGARPADTSSKVARALVVDAHDDGSGLGRPAPLHRRSDTGEVLRAYLAEQLAVLQEHDAGLQGETVHELRIAARRLRSVLASYRKHVEPGIVDPVREELRWLGQSLGAARDFEVLRRHLDEVLDGLDQPSDPTTPALRSRIDQDLDAAHRAGRRAAIEAVGSERYGRLVASLAALVEPATAPPSASRRARSALPKILERDVRRVRRAAKAAGRTAPGHEHDAALHEVRKKVKRLRYSAESATPVLGKPAKTLAKRAKALQQALGAHQDTVAARAWLHDLAQRADGDVEVAFGAGRLHAGEELRAGSAERDYDGALRRLPRKDVRDRLRGRSS